MALTSCRLRSARSFFLLQAPAPPTRAARLFHDWLWSEARR
ncbi:hypothetical protein [Sphingomonas gellani]|nr:hypothetical protein [Sphingomonas gellani]